MSGRTPASRPLGVSAVVFGAVVLLASAAAGFLLYRLTRPTPDGLYAAAPAQAPVPVPGSPAASAGPTDETASEPPPRIPERLPEITLPGPDGVKHRLADWKGRPLLINFWATWCDPCRREIPLLQRLRHERAADGLEVVGIAVDFADAARQYAASQRIDYPLLIAQEGGLTAVTAFGMDTVLPFSVFADREGRILTLKVGELHRDEAELILDRLRDVDAAKLTLADARAQIAAGLQRLNAARVTSGG